MGAARSLYVTDYGIVDLQTGMLEDRVALQTEQMWRLHEDDLIGVPEIEPDNDAVLTEMQRLAREQWERGGYGPWRLKIVKDRFRFTR